ncbi:hypothetical protein EBU95_02070 [bacterium]|nr:hypothetical protein [bacterium]
MNNKLHAGIVIVLVVCVLVVLYAPHLYLRLLVLGYFGGIRVVHVGQLHPESERHSPLTDCRAHKLFTDEFCKDIVFKVQNDPELQRINSVMSVIGTACYIHGSNGEYANAYPKTNKHLRDRYGDVLDTVLVYFKKRIDYDVQYTHALPGFHVFDCDGIFRLPVASIHTDNQYKYLPRDYHPDSDTFSFTVCFGLPESGGGLYLFEKDPVKVEYAPGYIVCHNGRTLHMIANSNGKRSERRITLQGHGIVDHASKVVWLYW